MNAPTEWLITTAGQGAAGLLVWSWRAMALLAIVCSVHSTAIPSKSREKNNA